MNHFLSLGPEDLIFKLNCQLELRYPRAKTDLVVMEGLERSGVGFLDSHSIPFDHLKALIRLRSSKYLKFKIAY